MTTLDDEEEPDHRSASPPRHPTDTASSRSRTPQYPSRDPPTTPLTNAPQPGVNNSLPYSAKSWNRNVAASFPQTRIHLHATPPPQYRGGGLSSSSSLLSEPTQELKWVNNNWEGNLDPPRPAAKKRRFDRELESDEGSVCSDSEVPAGVEFDSFRLRKRNAALKARVAQLKRDVGEACGRADAERMRREDAERFVGATRTLMSEYLGAPKRVEPERFISDTRNSMTLFLAEAKVKKKK
ncbi:hypothetical protein SLS55_007103 [Diplodia seriata]|uniref:BZIP domain-containing protein n=1 Tax=Diplodia seriata TaxID=420778 RepID=A0ABR3CBE4_9PEZI